MYDITACSNYPNRGGPTRTRVQLNVIASVVLVLVQVRTGWRICCTRAMVSKNRGKSGREHDSNPIEASTTAVELTGKGPPAIKALDPSYPSPSPDTGTPLPDDPSVLKENVKGLKSQLRRQARKVLPHRSSTVLETYRAIARG